MLKLIFNLGAVARFKNANRNATELALNIKREKKVHVTFAHFLLEGIKLFSIFKIRI